MKRFLWGSGKVVTRGAALGAALASLVMTGGAARAQDVVPKPLSVQVGAYFPSEQGAREASGEATFAIEANYAIENIVANNSLTYVSIGYIGHDDLSIIPLTVSQVFRDQRLLGQVGYYYGFGLGIYFTKMDLSDTSDKRKNLFGGFLSAGYEFGGSTFAELKYHLISKYDNKSVSGLQLTVGRRF